MQNKGGNRHWWTRVDYIRRHLGSLHTWQPWQKDKLKTTLPLKSSLGFYETHPPSTFIHLSIPPSHSRPPWCPDRYRAMHSTSFPEQTAAVCILCVDPWVRIRTAPRPLTPSVAFNKRLGETPSPLFLWQCWCYRQTVWLCFVRVRWQN